jgi:hypothetical protein
MQDRRTLFVLVPHLLQVDFRAEASPNHTQTARPGDGIRDRIVLIQIVFSEPCIYALVCEDGICDFALLVSCAYASCDALLHRPPLPLYAQNLGPSRDADCPFVSGHTLRKVYEDSKRCGEAMARVWNRGRVVCDQRAEFRSRRLGLRKDV